MAPSLPLMAVMMRKEVREILTMEVKKKKTGKLKWALQGSHKLWKSWKTWKVTKKSSRHVKIMAFKKNLNNHGKIMEFCEII